DAVALLQMIPAPDSRYRQACRLLGDVFVHMDMLSLALQKYSEAVGNLPVVKDSIESYYGLAKTLEKTGEKNKALEIYEKILAVQFDFEDVLQRVKNLRVPPAPPAPAVPPPVAEKTIPSAPAPPPPAADFSMTLSETTAAPFGFRVRDYEILEQ